MRQPQVGDFYVFELSEWPGLFWRTALVTEMIGLTTMCSYEVRFIWTENEGRDGEFAQLIRILSVKHFREMLEQKGLELSKLPSTEDEPDE